MNGFALGKAFQAVGNDLGVSTQIQFDQSMEQQQAAQRMQAQQANDNFRKMLADSNHTFEANQNAAKMAQQKSEFDTTSQQRAQANASREDYQNKMLAIAGTRAHTASQTAAATIAHLNAETKKALSPKSSGAPSMANLMNLNARLTEAIGAEQQKVGTMGLTGKPLQEAEATIQQLQAQQKQVQAMMQAPTAGNGSPTPAAPAPSHIAAGPPPDGTVGMYQGKMMVVQNGRLVPYGG